MTGNTQYGLYIHDTILTMELDKEFLIGVYNTEEEVNEIKTKLIMTSLMYGVEDSGKNIIIKPYEGGNLMK